MGEFFGALPVFGETIMKLAIGMHVCESVLAPIYFNHLSATYAWAKKYDFMYIGVYRMKVAAAREKIIEEAFEADCTHLFFMDSDHIMADNTLDFLVEHQDLAMVSGLICKRSYPFETVAFKSVNPMQPELKSVQLKANGKLYEVDACPFGCNLLNLEKIKKLESPYFSDGLYRSDISMCMRIRYELEEKICVDSRVIVGHLGNAPVVFPHTAQAMREKYVEKLVTL